MKFTLCLFPLEAEPVEDCFAFAIRSSGHGASTNSPVVQPSDDDATLRAAIERVVISRTTIEIELAEGDGE